MDLYNNEAGQSLVELALIMSLVIFATISIIYFLGVDLDGLYNNIKNVIDEAIL